MKFIIRALVFLVIAVAFFGTLGLVQDEFKLGNICPKVAGLPACYIILTCIILVFFGACANKKSWFFLGVFPALTIASYGTIGEIFGFARCPQTAGGVPMCFISFGIFLSLLVLWMMYTKCTASDLEY